MASPSLLTFDAEGRAVDFNVWLDDLQLFLQYDSKDGLSLFDLTSGASTAPAADADSTVRSQWLTRDAAARLAVRSHLPSTERVHFSQNKSAKTRYDAVVARYSSPATAELSRLMLLYLFPDLAAFATVTDLITHLRTSDTRYRAALPAEFCAQNPPPPPMYITLYYLVTRLPDTFCLEPLVVTPVPLSLRGAPPFLFCPLLPLMLLSTLLAPSRSALRLLLVRGAAPARASEARALEEVVGAAVVAVEAEEGVGVGVVAEVGASVATVEVEAALAVAGGVEEVEAAAAEVELVEAELCSGDPSSSSALVRPRRPSSFVSGTRGARGLGFPDATEIPRWGDLLRSGVAIFDLDFDAILAAMYAVSISAEGDCYVCVPPDPGIEAAALGARESAAPGTRESAALGAGESTLSGTAAAQVLHTFTLDSGASRSFFRDRTTLTPLSWLVAVSLEDPSRGPVLARYSTVLPCPAAPSGSLSGLYLPWFSTNLVSGADLQDAGVNQFTPASQQVTHCSCAQMGPPLATFTHRPGSSLYTLTTESPPIAASGQVAASSQVLAAASRSGPESAPCSCRLLSHQTLLWHHRLGHPSLPCLRGMTSRVLVSGLPWPLPPLPQGPAPACVPCVEGRQRAAPHSSEFPPTEAPLQTLHMDVWGPARVRGQGHERYFLLVVDDYSRYTTVFLLRSKGEVLEVLIDWIRVARLQLRERFGSDFPVLRLHSNRGGELSSDLLRAFCHAEGIRQMFTLPASPQQNGIAERRIGMVMDVARTSMIHAAAPHFLWPFAVHYAAHQINLQPRVSLPKTSPTLRWMGNVGDASAFRVWGSRAFVRDLSADKLSSRVVPCVFLGFPLTRLVGSFTTPPRAVFCPPRTSRFMSQVLQRFGFQYSSPQLTPLFTSHSLSAPPSDESVEPSGPYPELVGCLMYLMTCTRRDLAYPLSLLARYVAPGRHRKVHWDAAKRVLRYPCSTSGMGLVLGGRGPVVLTGHADASWELRWLTYLLTDLGEQPRSPPVLYVDNKAMIALCQERRLEHRTKHIALRYFLARELQQRGQLRLAYMATRANTSDVFTKALPPGDHQRFVTVLGLVPTLPHLLAA
ncbi:unnamed protein product [Closterium sp. NIES-54]